MGAISTQRLRSDSKIQQLCASLRELAFQRGPEAKLPTARELCERYDTSKVTLNDTLDILEEQGILYRKPGSGIYVSPTIHRKSICILCYSYVLAPQNSPFWGMLWGLFAQEAQRRQECKNEGYSFHMLLNAPEENLALSEDVIALVNAKKVHGVLAVGLVSPTYDWLEEQGIPSVVYAGRGSAMVTADTEQGLRQALHHLAGLGCHTVGYWTATIAFQNQDQVYFPRIAGPDLAHVARLYQEHHLAFHAQQVRRWDPPSLYEEIPPHILSYQQQGYQLAMEVFGQPDFPKPDGLYIEDDMLTSGAMQAFYELGIRIGQDVQIVSHANRGSSTLFGIEKYITRVEFDPAEIIQVMFDQLEKLMDGQPPEPPSIAVQPKLYHNSAVQRR